MSRLADSRFNARARRACNGSWCIAAARESRWIESLRIVDTTRNPRKKAGRPSASTGGGTPGAGVPSQVWPRPDAGSSWPAGRELADHRSSLLGRYAATDSDDKGSIEGGRPSPTTVGGGQDAESHFSSD
jgi:hypothetical protein